MSDVNPTVNNNSSSVVVLIEAIPLDLLDRADAALLAGMVLSSGDPLSDPVQLPLRAAALMSVDQAQALVRGSSYATF